MRKEKEESLCKNLGRIRRRRNLIKEGKDSNLFSTEAVLIEISKIILLRKNPRDKIPWEKGEDHQSNVWDANKTTCTRFFLIEEIKSRPCTTSKRIQ
jgi:hypothetical protein